MLDERPGPALMALYLAELSYALAAELDAFTELENIRKGAERDEDRPEAHPQDGATN